MSILTKLRDRFLKSVIGVDLEHSIFAPKAQPETIVPQQPQETMTRLKDWPVAARQNYMDAQQEPAPAPVSRLSSDKVYDMYDPNNEMGTYLKKNEQQTGIKARLMAALIQKESSGNPKSYRSNPALANDTSWGLTQPTPLALQEIGYFSPGQTQPTPAQEAELYDPEKNIDLSTQYLNKRVLNGFKYTGDPMKDATAIYKKYNGAVDPNDPRLKAFKQIYLKTKSLY